MWGYDQDTLGQIWELAQQRPPPLGDLEVGQYVTKTAPRLRVISIPWLCDAGGCILERSGDKEDPYTISDHGEGVPLGHVLLAMQEVAWPLRVAHHQCGPVAVTVKGKLRSTEPLMSDVPEILTGSP